MKHLELFVGRIGRIDDEVRELSNGNCVANFSVAETPRIKKGNEWVDGVTIWTEVSIFGDEARNLVRSVKPGTFVMVYGTRSARQYETKDTKETRTVQSIVADTVGVAITKFNYVESIGNVNYKAGSTSTSKPAPAAKQTAKPADKPFEDSFVDFGSEDDDPFSFD